MMKTEDTFLFNFAILLYSQKQLLLSLIAYVCSQICFLLYHHLSPQVQCTSIQRLAYRASLKQESKGCTHRIIDDIIEKYDSYLVVFSK